MWTSTNAQRLADSMKIYIDSSSDASISAADSFDVRSLPVKARLRRRLERLGHLDRFSVPTSKPPSPLVTSRR